MGKFSFASVHFFLYKLLYISTSKLPRRASWCCVSLPFLRCPFSPLSHKDVNVIQEDERAIYVVAKRLYLLYIMSENYSMQKPEFHELPIPKCSSMDLVAGAGQPIHVPKF